LYDVEERPGVAIDGDTHAAVDKKLFFGSYMRLRPGVKMLLWAECMEGDIDVIAQYFEDAEQTLVFGGQRGVVTARLDDDDTALPSELLAHDVKLTGNLVKWVLLTPAAFQSGSLPNFLNTDGEVMLMVKNGAKPERSAYRNRDDYRRACREASRPLGARLVAAVIPKNTSYSGWNCEFGRPERTLKLVPGGSVYYFEAADAEEAQVLAKMLNSSRNSEFFGSQGMGVGICAPFNYIDFNSLNK
jgi:CRISPR type III-B/RAMP module-associated protein Cmr3